MIATQYKHRLTGGACFLFLSGDSVFLFCLISTVFFLFFVLSSDFVL